MLELFDLAKSRRWEKISMNQLFKKYSSHSSFASNIVFILKKYKHLVVSA